MATVCMDLNRLSCRGPNSPSYSYLTINQTDLPLRSFHGYETATVSATDSVPAWLLELRFLPQAETTTFSIYLEYERKYDAEPRLIALDRSFVVASAVPIPSAVWLLGSAFIGLVGFRRKFKR